MTASEVHVPPGIDASKPTIARAYDATLGGKDNFAPDRAVAEQLTRTMPQIRDLAWFNRAILGRGVRYLAAFGALEMVPPGLVHLPEWRPDRPIGEELSVAERLMVGGIARQT